MRRLNVVDGGSSRSAIREALPPRPEGFASGGALVDARGRSYRYLRLSVTDRCDFACVYCMPPGGEVEHAVRKELLTFEEAARLVGVFADAGVERVRFTGGEPLVRKDVVRLVETVHRRAPRVELALTTNASRLAELARPLRAAGLAGVNVSIDTLEPERFARLTRGGALTPVLAGIRAALDVGLEVKTNTVAMRGENDHELGALVDWAWELGITPRFIELMPIGEGAGLAHRQMHTPEIEALLGERVGARAGETRVRGPARYRSAGDGSGRRVGFITPLSSEFCDDCNRVRITAQGDVRACLADRRALSLRDVMRGGGSDADLRWAIEVALSGKAESHFFANPAEHEHEHVGMSLIGG